MAQMSARVESQKKNSLHVVSSVQVHKTKVADILASTLHGLSAAQISQFLGALATALDAQTKALEQLEMAYVKEQADDDGYRQERDQATIEGQEALNNAAYRLRSIPHKQDLLKKYGIPTTQVDTPHQLANTLKHTGTLLCDAAETYTDAFGQEVHPHALGKFLLQKAERLERGVEDVKREQRELQDALIERDRVLERWGDVYQGTASALEGLYRIAGLRELADRVRPTVRRRRGEETPTQPIDDPNLSTPHPPEDPTNTND